MRVSKIGTKLLVMLLIVAIILPYSSEVLAIAVEEFDFFEEEQINNVAQDLEETFEEELTEEIVEDEALEQDLEQELEVKENEEELTGALTHTMQSAKLGSEIFHEGGTGYQIANSSSSGRTTVFELVEKSNPSVPDYEDALYCLNAEKSFPAATDMEYKNMGDLKSETGTAGSSIINSIGAKNYKSLVWLIDNMYLPNQQSEEEKVEFIEKAFASEISKNVIPPVTAEYIMETITDDDIEVVQQWAIWYFTNGNNDGISSDYSRFYDAKYSSFGSVYVKGVNIGNDWVSLSDYTGNGARQELLNVLYNYLITNAKNATSASSFTAPSFAMQNSDIKCTVDGDYYKVGPFNVNAGSVSASIKLVDGNGNEIDRSKYQIKIDGENDFSNKNVNEIFGKNYYVYLPIEGNNISKVKLTIDYRSYETEASLWTPMDSTYQPAVLITRGEKTHSDSREKDIDSKKFDLALRKYIIKAGSTSISNRIPEVNPGTIATTGTAEYKHRKYPVTVKPGETVVYEIRVYNEGSLDGTATKITDYLPAGMTLAENSSINETYGWTLEDGRVATTSHLADSVIDAYSGSGEPDSLYVQIECKLADDLAKDITENLILTNVAEITEYSRTDNDSEPSINTSTIDTKTFSGDKDNKEELNDPEYYYKGLQDDDDFEKVVIDQNVFDLSLQKFITGLNNDKVTDREPTITKNSDGTFRYSHTTEALKVSNKDLVTYTIRVYNEGDIDGYAKEVMDDIPTGLKYLPDNNVNKEYEWKMYDKNGKETTDVNQAASIKTQYLSKANEKDGRSNLIEAYNDSKQTPSYRDVKVVFEVTETALPNKTERTIINTAEITDDEDKDGNPVDDKDSTPGNNKSGEDDIDQERVSVKYFDLALKKSLTKIIITENGKTREINAKNEDDLLKVEINRKYIDKTTVKFVYNITVTNQGEIAGYAKELKDHIPAGLKFVAEDNKDWTTVSDDVVKTEALANTLLEPGKSASVAITLQWENSENNLGQKVNIAEISKDYNDVNSPDIDSTPDNFKAGEDDQDDAPVILSISTGEEPVYIVLSTTVMAILVTGIILIKKYVLI